MNKILLLGSIVSPCPPLKQGGTEWVAYYQAKALAKNGFSLIFVGAQGTKQNFSNELRIENERQTILNNIEFVEIGGGTGFGNQKDSIKTDLKNTEASRKLRLETINLALVMQLMQDRQNDYDIILNNLRGEAVLNFLAFSLKKKFITVMHLNIFPELAEIFLRYNTRIVTISDWQKKQFPNLNYLATIPNPISTATFSFSENPDNYALMISTIGYHKNQKDAIIACQKSHMPLILAGKIRDQEYFDKEIKPCIDGKTVKYIDEVNLDEKLKLYQKAKVFLFPINWNEPFGLVLIEALSCGTPIISYPHGGPQEIVQEGTNGYLVNSPDQMSEKIKIIDNISRIKCRNTVLDRYEETIVGKMYIDAISRSR